MKIKSLIGSGQVCAVAMTCWRIWEKYTDYENIKNIMGERVRVKLPCSTRLMNHLFFSSGAPEWFVLPVAWWEVHGTDVNHWIFIKQCYQIVFEFIVAPNDVNKMFQDAEGEEYLIIFHKIKRPADLSIVERLGGFLWCKGKAFIWIVQGFLCKSVEMAVIFNRCWVFREENRRIG